MSYVQSNDFYSNRPRPYLTSDVGEPVPGWGSNPQIAGPPRVGVGAFGDAPAVCPPGTKFDPSKSLCVRAVTKSTLTAHVQRRTQECVAAGGKMAGTRCVLPTGASYDTAEVGGGIMGAIAGAPWWALLGGAVVIGGGVAYVVSR